MRSYLIRRFLQLIPVFLGILILIFLILELSPGDPTAFYTSPGMTAAQKADIIERFGLNEPLHVRFFLWVTNALKGDFGRSTHWRQPVTELLKPMIAPTLQLSLYSLLISLLIGIPAGIVSATKQYSWEDNALSVFSLLGISMPSFFFGLVMILIFSVNLGWFPLFGLSDPGYVAPNAWAEFWHRIWHLTLPAIVLGLGGIATFMRYTRSSMLEVIKSDYIRTARAKGMKERVVIYRHAFRNAVIPIITLLGFWIPGLLSGAVITETVFGLPGLGRISVMAVNFRDYPVIIAVTAMLSILTLIGTILADVFYAIADPRIRYE